MSVLRMARQEADLTQREMGNHLGYSEDVISNMEALRTPISFADAVLWARHSHLSEADLFEQSLYALRRRGVRNR